MKNKEDGKKKNVMDDKIYNDSVELYGLKKYLDEFSMIDTKEVMDVKLWDEYLMFAYLFGIADLVYKQLKEMYPKELEIYEISDDTIDFIDMYSDRVSNVVYKDYGYKNYSDITGGYSSGGGGFSSGGDGGGSFGGGGSMGGR